MLLAFPETSHPGTLGIDKQPSLSRRWLPVFVNPLTPLGLLRSPNLLVAVRNLPLFRIGHTVMFTVSPLDTNWPSRHLDRLRYVL